MQNPEKTYITYGIQDPRTGKFVYVGQTADLDERKKYHLKKKKRRPRIQTSNIKVWLYDLLAENIQPSFHILESVETEADSLLSETKWVAKLAEEGHPLLNRWREHRTIIKSRR